MLSATVRAAIQPRLPMFPWLSFRLSRRAPSTRRSPDALAPGFPSSRRATRREHRKSRLTRAHWADASILRACANWPSVPPFEFLSKCPLRGKPAPVPSFGSRSPPSSHKGVDRVLCRLPCRRLIRLHKTPCRTVDAAIRPTSIAGSPKREESAGSAGAMSTVPTRTRPSLRPE
jgi:hypothetical protein